MSIESEITRLQKAKASIKTSIESKGIDVGNGTIDTYSSKIDAIQQGITPTGSINITENGTHDVTDYASAIVNVESGEDIHDYIEKTMTGGTSTLRPSLLEYIKKIPSDTIISGTSANYMFNYCTGLTEFPEIDTSNITTFKGMFTKCSSLTTVAKLNMSQAGNIQSMFSSASALANLGGFENLGEAYLNTATANYAQYGLDLSDTDDLTEQSMINVLNNLYDIASKGCNAQEVILGSNLDKLISTEGQQALANAQAKGWSIS